MQHRSDKSARWHGEGGYRQLLAIAFPLIMSTGSWSLQHFVDRMFLAWYSPESLAASTPAGILSFTLLSPFLGIAGYVSTFVAQYFGAERPERIGPTVWQGVYISVVGGAALALFIPVAEPMFRAIGHPDAIGHQEAVYFRILCLGAFPGIACAALAGLFSGRGKTWPVMWVNFLGTAVNVVLDYLMIFGVAGFPELGIAGAAIATDLSMVASLVAYTVLMSRDEYDRRYRTRHGWRLDPALLSRILRFGLPNGIQFFIDMAGFTVFLLIVGRLGTVSLAATNIALNVNTLAFMPMIGLGMTVGILVGQCLGRDEPEIAERCVWSGLHVTMLYMATVALLYVLVPGLFLAPFGAYATPGAYDEIRGLAVVLLRFVALYSVFDVLNIVFASALKGAGDTRFVMYLVAALSTGILVVPSYVAIEVLGAGVVATWAIGTMYISVLGIGFYLRFRGGAWRRMRVIERQPVRAGA